MNIKIKNELLDIMVSKYPEYMKTEFIYDDKVLTIKNLLQMLLYSYEKQTQLGEDTTSYDVIMNFPNMGYYRKVGCPEFTNSHINTLMQIMFNLGLAEKGKYFSMLPNKYVNFVELTLCNVQLNEEGKYTLEQASKESPIDVAMMLFELPDDAIKILIKEYVVRINEYYSSGYNNLPNTKNLMRVSNHWNVDDDNKIDLEDGELIKDRWIVGLWNDVDKIYKKHSEYPKYKPVRTKKEKIKIIDDLIDGIYFVNKFATFKLNQFKHTLEDDIDTTLK